MIMNFFEKSAGGYDGCSPDFWDALSTPLSRMLCRFGGITTATFSSAGGNCDPWNSAILYGYVKLRLKEMPAVLKRGGLLLVAKFAIGAILGILVGRILWPCRYSWHLKYGNHLCGHKQ